MIGGGFARSALSLIPLGATSNKQADEKKTCCNGAGVNLIKRDGRQPAYYFSVEHGNARKGDTGPF